MILPEIFVMDRGFVLVGRPRQDPEDWMFLLLDDCCTVRIWGTEHGLGQLASDGPLADTILDPEGNNVAINKMFISRRIRCSEEGWGQWGGSTLTASAHLRKR